MNGSTILILMNAASEQLFDSLHVVLQTLNAWLVAPTVPSRARPLLPSSLWEALSILPKKGKEATIKTNSLDDTMMVTIASTEAIPTVGAFCALAAIAYFVLMPARFGKKARIAPQKPKLPSKNRQQRGPVCPFSKDTSFEVSVAANVALAPLEVPYEGPTAARWLNMGISGQDTPGKLRAGLKRLRDSKYFLNEDENLEEELDLKQKNLDENHSECFVMEESSLDAQREVLDLFLSYLPRRYPDIYMCDATSGTISVTLPSSKVLKFRLDDWSHAPLELCERIVQEDLILMRPDDTGTPIHSYKMAAAAVVFSFRELSQKLSQPAEIIHAPVPGFAVHIQKSLNLMFSKLVSDKPMWRNNWGISKTAALDQPLYGSSTAQQERRMNNDTIHDKFLKVEYQTIRRLPKSKYLLFTVRTMVDEIQSLESVPLAAACLAKSIRGMSSAMHQYKGIDNANICDKILHYLDSISFKDHAS